MKNHVRCSVREPARCAMNSSWPSRIFFPSHSLVAPSVSLASWWRENWVSEVGRTLTALFGSFGIALKFVRITVSTVGFSWPRSPCHVWRRGCPAALGRGRCPLANPLVPAAPRAGVGNSRFLEVLLGSSPTCPSAGSCRCHGVNRSVDVAPSPPCELPTHRVAARLCCPVA